MGNTQILDGKTAVARKSIRMSAEDPRLSGREQWFSAGPISWGNR